MKLWGVRIVSLFMTSVEEDLEQALRENIRLRRELGARAAEGKAAIGTKQSGGIAYRLGRVLVLYGLGRGVRVFLGKQSARRNPEGTKPST